MYIYMTRTWFPGEISLAFRSINSLLKYVLFQVQNIKLSHFLFSVVETNKVCDNFQ